MLQSGVSERLARAHATSLANLRAGVGTLVAENQRLARRVSELEALLSVVCDISTQEREARR